MNTDNLSRSGIIINPTPKKPNENLAKGKLYSKNKVNAIVNRVKSPILATAENTFYSSRFNNFERELLVYYNKQEEIQNQMSKKIDKLKEVANQIKISTSMTLTTKSQMSEVLKSLKIIKNKLEKSNVSYGGKLNKERKEDEKITNIKLNVIKKHLKNIFTDGDNTVEQIKLQVKEHLGQFRKNKKTNKKKVSTQSGSLDQNRENKKTIKKYLNMSKKIIDDYQISLKSNFISKLQTKRKTYFSKAMERLEEERRERSASHSQIYDVVRNTQIKVDKMLASKKIDLGF